MASNVGRRLKAIYRPELLAQRPPTSVDWKTLMASENPFDLKKTTLAEEFRDDDYHFVGITLYLERAAPNNKSTGSLSE